MMDSFAIKRKKRNETREIYTHLDVTIWKGEQRTAQQERRPQSNQSQHGAIRDEKDRHRVIKERKKERKKMSYTAFER